MFEQKFFGQIDPFNPTRFKRRPRCASFPPRQLNATVEQDRKAQKVKYRKIVKQARQSDQVVPSTVYDRLCVS